MREVGSVDLGIRWGGAVQPSRSYLGQAGDFQFLGGTRNKKLARSERGTG